MTKGQETAQRLIAIVVIMAMLGVMGIPLTVIVFFATVVYFVWRAVQRSEQQDVKNIFDFYISANEIGEKMRGPAIRGRLATPSGRSLRRAPGGARGRRARSPCGAIPRRGNARR